MKRAEDEIRPGHRVVSPKNDERELRRRIARDLAELGLLGDAATRTADALFAQLGQKGRGEYETLLAGLRVSQSLREEWGAAFLNRQRKLREVEKLMSGFASELRKFDEVLEVLSTYVRRMRSCAGEDETDNLLH